MDKLEAIKRFITVCDTGSFTQAADKLGIPKSAVSASISQLESSLKTRLLNRSTRQITLTEIGERYLISCRKIVEDLEDLEQQIQIETGEISGLIRVDMPSRFMSTIVLPHLNSWFKLYPHTKIELSGTDFRINPIAESVDCLVRVGTLDSSDLIARPLGLLTMINCVSPEYIRHFGKPETLDSLQQHLMVHYVPGSKSVPCEFEYQIGADIKCVKVPYRVTVNNTDSYLSACINGQGIVQLPLQGVQQYLKDGRLIEVLPELTSQPMPVSILYASRRHMPRRIETFMQWLKSTFNSAVTSNIAF